MLSRNIMRVLFWAAAVVSTLLLMAPGGLFGEVSFGRADLVVHLVMMAAVSALGVIAYERYRLPLIIGLGTAAMGSEILQIIVPDRYFDLTDLAANAVGIMLGFVIGWLITPIALKRAPLAINR